jgi:hypothetical protein
MIKRPFVAGEPDGALLAPILDDLDVRLPSYRTFSAASIQEHRPVHAGSLPTFPTFAPGDIAAKQPVLRQWKDRVYAASAAAAAGPVLPRTIN